MQRLFTVILSPAVLLAYREAEGGESRREATLLLKVGPDGRYQVSQNDDHFLMIGDALQALMVNASLSDAGSLLANNASNLVLVLETQ